MKYIEKKANNEPQSLIEHRSTPNATFEGCNKNDIREALIQEQGGICAYCMKRINNKRNTELNKYYTEIEHYRSQDVYNGQDGKADLRLNYQNMLGVCNGNSGQPTNKLHCDKSKDTEQNKKFLPLKIDPLKPSCEYLVQFRGNGVVFSTNEEIDVELTKVLNLNEENLVKNRKIAIDFAIQSINTKQKKKKVKKWSIAMIREEQNKWAKLYNTGYKEYCQAVINYLDKKLKQYQQ